MSTLDAARSPTVFERLLRFVRLNVMLDLEFFHELLIPDDVVDFHAMPLGTFFLREGQPNRFCAVAASVSDEYRFCRSRRCRENVTVNISYLSPRPATEH
jgi:hypothetical protein